MGLNTEGGQLAVIFFKSNLCPLIIIRPQKSSPREQTRVDVEKGLHEMGYGDMPSKGANIMSYRRLGAKGSYLPLWRVSDRIL